MNEALIVVGLELVTIGLVFGAIYLIVRTLNRLDDIERR